MSKSGKPHASNKAAAAKADKPVGTITSRGRTYDKSWDDKFLLIYDDIEFASVLADVFGTYFKSAPNKHPNGAWQTFSIVRLPGT